MILLSNAIHTEGLTKYYGKARGILDLNLSVEQGEFFGFIGPNGAGKSTTIRTLLGLISPSSGRARVLGLEIHRQREAILRQVGYLPSETAYDSGMRVQELLRLSAALRKADCRQEAEQLCQRLQLDPSQRVDDLSYGNRKKVAIVCALQSKPRLLILDEPTGGLDPLIQHEFFKLLQERKQQGATVFLSSHVLSEIQQRFINHSFSFNYFSINWYHITHVDFDSISFYNINSRALFFLTVFSYYPYSIYV